MNFLHMKYAVEVARLGSLSKAADSLHTAQPNISRAIKDLEADLGITLFTRSRQGMELTPEGETFVGYAGELLRQMDDLEMLYREGGQKKRRLSLAAPRSAYISEAVADFSASLGSGAVELSYRGTQTKEILAAVEEGDCKLGILRYDAHHDRYVKTLLEERGIAYELLASFSPVILMSCQHPLATQKTVTAEELTAYPEVVCTDSFASTFPTAASETVRRAESTLRRICVSDRAASLDLLTRNPETFMWSPPVSHDTLERQDLALRICAQNDRVWKDLLIHREDHRFTKEEKQLITALCNAKRRHFSE